MRHWSDSRLRALASFDFGLQPLFNELPLITRGLRFEYWCYIVVDPESEGRVLFLNTNLPETWISHYILQGLYAEDPHRRHGLISLEALHWQPELFVDAPLLWQAMCELNITQGMSQACHHRSGLIAILSFCGTVGVLEAAEFSERVEKVLLLANRLTIASVERIANDVTLQPQDELTLPLTRREVTILRKTAEGRTAAHIAKEMSLSQRTVQFHISSTINKLEVPNKTAAVAEAIWQGLLRR